MFRSDVRRVEPTGPSELPPYYAQRLQAVEPPSVRSARYEAARGSPEAEARRLFRDFKLGLLTLVIVSLLLLAYFWDGADHIARTRDEPQEDVLSFWVTAQRRGELLSRAHDRFGRAASRRRTRKDAPLPSSVDSSARSKPARPARRAFVYTVRNGDTLSAIALRFYGDASLWKEILRANTARLRRPSDLRVGMKLIVPARIIRKAQRAGPAVPTASDSRAALASRS